MLADQWLNRQHSSMADDLDVVWRRQQCEIIHQRRILYYILQANQCHQVNSYDLVVEVRSPIDQHTH